MKVLGFRHGVHPPERKSLTAQARRSGGCRSRTRSCCRCGSTRASRRGRWSPGATGSSAATRSPRPTATSRCHSTPAPRARCRASSGGRTRMAAWPRRCASPWTASPCRCPGRGSCRGGRRSRAAEVAQAVQEAGVVGLGGAAFPAHVKMVPPPDVKVETLILNGAECEPYLTSDHRVMVEYPDRVHFGARIMMAALGVERAVIGVESNKPDAVEALRATIPADLDIRSYPHREVSAGRGEDADPRAHRAGGAVGQAAGARRRRSCRTSAPSRPWRRSSRPDCRWWSGSSASPAAAWPGRPT
jgi:hypothetical protein